jgi:hypothetical protein
VDVEHGEEGRDPEAGGVAEPQLSRRAYALDGRDAPVGGSHDQPVAQRRHAWRIAEEVGDIRGRQHSEPGQRRPQPEQQERDARADGQEPVALAVHRHDTVGDGVDQAVALGHVPSSVGRISEAKRNPPLQTGRCIGGLRALP